MIFVLSMGSRTKCSPVTKVQVGKDQEKAQSEKDSHSKNRGGKKPPRIYIRIMNGGSFVYI